MDTTDPRITPDMQAAGVSMPQEPMSQGGIIDALRSRGTLPADLAQTMQPIGQGPSSGLAAGSAVLNLFSGGNAARNPYLEQHQVQQNRQFWQQNQIAQMQEREMRRRAQKEEAAFAISSSLLKAESPEARKTGAQGVIRHMRTLGMQAPDSLVNALASKRLDDAELNSMYRDIHLGMNDQALLVKYPNATPQDVIQARGSKDNPIILKTLGLKTPEDLLRDTYDLRIKAATALEKEQPKIHGDPNRVGAILMKHRELFGKDYAEGDTDTQQRAYKAAISEIDAAEERKMRLKNELDLQKLLSTLQLKSTLTPTPQAKPVPIQVKQKMLEPFSKAQGVVKGIEMLEDALKEMPKGALPTGDDVASQYYARLQRATLYKGNPAVVKFQQLWGPVSIGQIDRGMFDEKGVRAIAAFTKQLEAVDNMPSRAALDQYLAVVKRELTRSTESRIEDLEALDNTPPDVLERAKSLTLGLTGKGPTRGPLNPEKDPLGILR